MNLISNFKNKIKQAYKKTKRRSLEDGISGLLIKGFFLTVSLTVMLRFLTTTNLLSAHQHIAIFNHYIIDPLNHNPIFLLFLYPVLFSSIYFVMEEALPVRSISSKMNFKTFFSKGTVKKIKSCAIIKFLITEISLFAISFLILELVTLFIYLSTHSSIFHLGTIPITLVIFCMALVKMLYCVILITCAFYIFFNLRFLVFIFKKWITKKFLS